MKREGFTLIELLAVIVILAIIALIATPIILNIINDAKKESNERSIEMYASAVKNAVAIYQLKEGKAPTTFEDLEEYITYEGEEVVCETSELNSDGSIYLVSCKVGDTVVEGYTYGEKETVSYKKYNNGEVVYFNVTTGESCTDYTESQSATEVKEGCMKFYAYNDSESSETVNLLLDHNISISVVWNSSGSSVNGPDELLEQLQSDTENWIGTEIPSNYSLTQDNVYSPATDNYVSVNYTVDYSEYKARLISADEIAQITGNSSWNVTNASSMYFFDSLTDTESNTCKVGDTSGCQYGWLYDRTRPDCIKNGCLNNSDLETYLGYWTVSSKADSSGYAWYVNGDGVLFYSHIHTAGDIGVRPVITVLKSKL